ncbi:MAG: GntR family transcriptional regulator [Ectothiorhodospiraceae bacterium]|nr:GntR family transcriptional regulator [Ectothiorhodospiraceae bacterium]
MSLENPLTYQPFKRPNTLQQAVLDEVRNRILDGRMRPGSAIRQEALADSLGLSRIPVREALKTLEGEGLVEYVAGRGFFVVRLSVADLREIYHIAGLLERDAVRHAVPRLDEASEARILGAMEAMEKADPAHHETLVQRNRNFHFSIYEVCGMPRLLRLLEGLWNTSQIYQSMFYTVTGAFERACAEHREIYQACVERRTEDAVELLATHRDDAMNLVTELMLKPECD